MYSALTAVCLAVPSLDARFFFPSPLRVFDWSPQRRICALFASLVTFEAVTTSYYDAALSLLLVSLHTPICPLLAFLCYVDPAASRLLRHAGLVSQVAVWRTHIPSSPGPPARCPLFDECFTLSHCVLIASPPPLAVDPWSPRFPPCLLSRSWHICECPGAFHELRIRLLRSFPLPPFPPSTSTFAGFLRYSVQSSQPTPHSTGCNASPTRPAIEEGGNIRPPHFFLRNPPWCASAWNRPPMSLCNGTWVSLMSFFSFLYRSRPSQCAYPFALFVLPLVVILLRRPLFFHYPI